LSRALGVSAEEFFAGIGWQQEPPRLVVATGPSRFRETKSIRPI
jgi:hypothetical protein